MERLIFGMCRELRRSGIYDEVLSQFKALKSDEERFSKALNLLSEYNVIPDSECGNKNIQQSIDLRIDGNQVFLTHEANYNSLYSAWFLYTKSIVMAPDMSEMLAISYANRSAVLTRMRKYSEAIEDIDRALSMNYPDSYKDKLSRRKVECLNGLREAKLEVAEIQKLSFGKKKQKSLSSNGKKFGKKKLTSRSGSDTASNLDTVPDEIQCSPIIANPHTNIPCASDAISLQYSDKYGRHLIANRKINIGEFLIVEKPYSYFIHPEEMYTHCAQCMKFAWTAIPCQHCIYAVYCSEKCKNEAWVQWHDIECSIYGYLLNLDLHQRSFLGLRTAILAVRQAGGIEQLKKKIEKMNECKDPLKKLFAQDGLFHSESYESIYALETHAEKRSAFDILERAFTAAFIIYHLYVRTVFFENRSYCNLTTMCSNKDVIFMGGLVLRHLQTIPVNSISYNEHIGDNVKLVGSLLAGYLSFMNHSCMPNVSRTSTKEGFAVIYAVLPIEKGSQIYYNYGNHHCNKSFAERQSALNYQYYFTCGCISCGKGELASNALKSHMPILSSVQAVRMRNLMEKCNMYKTNLLTSTKEDKEEAIKKLCSIIGALFNLLPPLSIEISYAVETLQVYIDAMYGVKYETAMLEAPSLQAPYALAFNAAAAARLLHSKLSNCFDM